MAANTETVVQDAGGLGTGGSKKRLKQKGNADAVRWDILDNKDIKAEKGWEVEMEEYWTSKTSKKYVKMYHVDKLWPRGCHEMNTKSFTARPHMCNNDHFLHRAQEVWRTLFGDRQKNKGFFNYSLLSMVYTELILKKKVDWTSFPTTAQFPLRIGRNQKHIPDSFNPQSTSTKDLLVELKSRSNRQSTVDSMRMLQHSGKEDMVKPDCENNVDTVIENILTTTVTEDLVQEKSGDDRTEPRIVDVGIVQGKQKEVAVQEGRNMDGEVADQCNVVALEAIPVQTNDAGPSTSISSPALPDFEKLLQSIPNSDGLKQLLDVNVNWAGLCAKKHGGEVPSADGDDQKAEFSVKAQEMYEVLRVATNLKGGAGVLAAMAPDLLDMAHTFAAVIPSVLEAATGFEKFASPIMSLLEEMVKQMEQLIVLEDEVAKTRD